MCIAGEWAGFDQEWLESRILNHLSSHRFFILPRFMRTWMLRDKEWLACDGFGNAKVDDLGRGNTIHFGDEDVGGLKVRSGGVELSDFLLSGTSILVDVLIALIRSVSHTTE
jgi:hypothetical protein